MRTLKMRNEEYLITKNNKEYDLEVTPENVLSLSKGQETYYTIDLNKGSFDANVEILKTLGIEIETVPLPKVPVDDTKTKEQMDKIQLKTVSMKDLCEELLERTLGTMFCLVSEDKIEVSRLGGRKCVMITPHVTEGND